HTSTTFCLLSAAHPPHLHSFPTRRSSDLDVEVPINSTSRQRDSSEKRIHPRGHTPHASGPPGRAWSSSTTRLAGGPDAISRRPRDRKSTRLNSSHLGISYAVFCLKKKKKT